MKINTKKSREKIGISLKLIKLSTELIKGHLSLIFSESFKEGIVPEKGHVHEKLVDFWENIAKLTDVHFFTIFEIFALNYVFALCLVLS